MKKYPNCAVAIEDTEIEGRIIKCPMCKTVIEDVCVLSPGMIARFYKWTGTVNNVNGVQHESWYCQKHSTKEIKVFEESGGIK
jgi:hypothetical protein